MYIHMYIHIKPGFQGTKSMSLSPVHADLSSCTIYHPIE